ncbi:putative quinol monooxygenase [Rhodococcus globerulus]|uniref:Quinol monooxygenase n=1 Tax=Rhodococcus globerulus TaxID=33008 RepID=A0ABU4C5D1_RHOGO|nr:putative quinol monooxygenase [Rhodococcus globerulus]MDV6271479.1 putative quinol monooxygenase [Rhodococcus globerulus]
MSYVVRATWTSTADSVDVIGEVLRELAPLSRQEPGNELYVVHQEPNQPLVFHLFEVYTDEEAYRAHGESDHFQRLAVEKAIPILKSREREFHLTLDF